jgi:hypothetical protein
VALFRDDGSNVLAVIAHEGEASLRITTEGLGRLTRLAPAFARLLVPPDDRQGPSCDDDDEMSDEPHVS